MSINDTQTLSSAKEKDYSELDRVLHSYTLNPPKMFNILWRDKFSKDLIRINKRYLRAATQILTEHACLNYHLNRSVQPLCPLCEAEYYTIHCTPFVGTISNALAVESRVLRHSLHHWHGHSGQIQPEKDHLLHEQNKPEATIKCGKISQKKTGCTDMCRKRLKVRICAGDS